MAEAKNPLIQHPVGSALYRFLGGALLGLFMLLIPYLIVPVALNVIPGAIASVFGLICGFLASRLGGRFIEGMVNLLGGSGLY